MIKRVAEAGYLSKKETEAVKEWKFKSEEENTPKERQKKQTIENVEVYKAIPKAENEMQLKALEFAHKGELKNIGKDMGGVE
jgi:hypothetical protein